MLRRQHMELRAERAKDVMLCSAGEFSWHSDISHWKYFYSQMYAFTSSCISEFEKQL
jgi:hypothetical protein